MSVRVTGDAEGVEQELRRDKEVKDERHRGGRGRDEDRRRGSFPGGQDPERGQVSDPGGPAEPVDRDHRPGHHGGEGRLRSWRGVRGRSGPYSGRREQGYLRAQPARDREHPPGRGVGEQDRPVGHGGERRQRGGLGRVPLRGREGHRAPGLHNPRYRGRRRGHHPRGAPQGSSGSGRGAGARDPRPHGTALRLRQPRLPRGARLGHRHPAQSAGGCQRPAALGVGAARHRKGGARGGCDEARPGRGRGVHLGPGGYRAVAGYRPGRVRKHLQPGGDSRRRRRLQGGRAYPGTCPQGGAAQGPLPFTRPRRDKTGHPGPGIRRARRRRARSGRRRGVRAGSLQARGVKERWTVSRHIGDLPHALEDGDQLASDLAGRRPAVFLDYDGTLTPIVDRPEDALISESMRDAVRELAGRCPVCVVSGRDRRVVQELMGVDDLIVAGSHGFDIWSPAGGEIQREEGANFAELLEGVEVCLREELGGVKGALVEPKKSSVAAHYRLVSEDERSKVRRVVEEILAEHPGELKVTPGKMVYEVQPNIDWDKGKAVLYVLEALGLDGDDVAPMYLGDDLTDEDAFEALNEASPRGIGVFVGRVDDPEVAGRTTAADYVLDDVREVERFLNALAH